MFSLFSGPKKPLSSKPPGPANVSSNATGNTRLMKGMLQDRAAQLPKGNMGSNVSALAKQTNVVGMKGVGVEKRTVMGNTRNVRNWAAARRAAAAPAAAANASVAVPVAANASSAAAANDSSGAAANASTNAAKGGYRKTRRNRNRKTRRNRNRKNRY